MPGYHQMGAIPILFLLRIATYLDPAHQQFA